MLSRQWIFKRGRCANLARLSEQSDQLTALWSRKRAKEKRNIRRGWWRGWETWIYIRVEGKNKKRFFCDGMTVRMGFSLAMTCRLWTIHKRRPLDKRSPANLDAAVGCDYRFIHHRSSNTKYKKMMIKKTYSVFKCQKKWREIQNSFKRKDTSQTIFLLLLSTEQSNEALAVCSLLGNSFHLPVRFLGG